MNSSRKYCLQTTCTHRLAVRYKRCVEPIGDMLAAEGDSSKLFDAAHLGINLDAVETLRGKGERNKTCDFTFGLSKQKTSCEMVLVECKFRVKPQNYTPHFRSEIVEKIDKSKALLGSEPRIGQEVYVLVSANAQEQARRRFAQLFVGKSSHVAAATSQRLFSTFFAS